MYEKGRSRVTNNQKTLGGISEIKGRLRDYDVSYDIDDLIQTWKEAGVKSVKFLADTTRYKKNEEHYLLMQIEMPFLQDFVYLKVITKVRKYDYVHSFTLKSEENIMTKHQSRWLLLYLMDMFVYREVWNIHMLKRNILEGRELQNYKLYKTV